MLVYFLDLLESLNGELSGDPRLADKRGRTFQLGRHPGSLGLVGCRCPAV